MPASMSRSRARSASGPARLVVGGACGAVSPDSASLVARDRDGACDTGRGSVEFRGLGGPFRKGLIAVSSSDGPSPLRVIGRYDLDRHENIILPRPGDRASRFDLREAGAVEPWEEPLTSTVRQFYAAMSPIALFWVPDGDIQPLGLPLVELIRSLAGNLEHGTIRGFSPNPFLPVLIRSPWSGGVLTWTSEASEFEVRGLPAASYRIRAFRPLWAHNVRFGAHIGASGISSDASKLWSKLDLTEPDSREVMGFVRWESGVSAQGAEIYMQHAASFRRYLRRAEADENGFYRFTGVPGGEPYFIFALPRGEATAVRNFEYFGVPSGLREVSRESTLHPHRVTGAIPQLPATAGERVLPTTRRASRVLAVAQSRFPEVRDGVLQLVRVDGRAEHVAWSFGAESFGKFNVSNVPHGRYRVDLLDAGGQKTLSSLPLEVGDGRTEIVVEWPPSSGRGPAVPGSRDRTRVN